MKAIEIMNLLEKWASMDLVDEWDNTGFQIGDPERQVEKILLALDLDREVFKMAKDINAQMIITHHPIIFSPLKSLTKLNYKEKLIYDIIKEDIVVYNAHTNLDIAKGGVNDRLAEILGIKNTIPLKSVYSEDLYKLVVFVPNSHKDLILKVLGDEGAGYIGNYSHCSFNLEGIGTFMPHKGTHPYLGTVDKLEKVEETRIETIVKEKDLKRIINKMIKAHPYEEVAYDIYKLENKIEGFGYGRVGKIHKMPFEKYLDIIKKGLDTQYLIVYGNIDKNVETVAVCGGSGSSFIKDAFMMGADIYITGDIKYHDAQYGNELGLTLIDAGHFHTEKIILPVIKDYIERSVEKPLDIKIYNQSSPHYTVF